MLHPVLTQKPIRTLLIVITILNLIAEFVILRSSVGSPQHGLLEDLTLALVRSIALTLLTLPLWYIVKTTPSNGSIQRGTLLIIIPSLLLISIYWLILFGSEEFTSNDFLGHSFNNSENSRLTLPLALTARSI